MSRSVVRRSGGRVAIVAAVAVMVSLVLVPPAWAAPPSLGSLSRTSGPAGCGIAINGSNFQGNGAVAVEFFDPGGPSWVSTSETVISDSLIHTIAPGGIAVGDSGVRVTHSGGISTELDFDYVAAPGGCAPTITSFQPSEGPDGCGVTINGTNLLGVTDVEIGDVDMLSFNVVSDSVIEAIIDDTNQNTGQISVTSAISPEFYYPSNFTIPGTGGCDPSITSFSPTNGTAGTPVIITGSNFLGATDVRFDTTSAPGYVVLDASHISVVVPAGATTGPIHVDVFIGGGTVTADSSTNFIVGGPPPPPVPTCPTMSPTSGPTGTSVTITGTGLNNAQVTFNGFSSTETFNDSTQVDATVPLNATDGPVVVTTPGGSCSPGSFDVTTPPAPNITSISPTSGPIGTLVTITGTNLTGTTSVTFNGVASTSVTNVNATTVTATVPPTATTGEVNLTTPGGTDTTGPTFTVVGVPNVTTMSPTSGPVGTTVTFTGTNLGGATVKFNGVTASCSSNTATQIVCTVPTGATTGPVTVQTAGGTDSTVGTFTVTVAVPTVTGFSPSSGQVGDLVSITGTNFIGTTVRFGLINASFTLNSSTSITATVPAGAGTSHISVTTAGGTGTSGLEFVVKHPRSVSLHFSKASGSVSVLDGWSQCGSIVPVRIQHKVNGQWKNVFQGFTNSNGSYSFAGITDPGKYRVIVKKFTTAAGDVCLKDKSPTATL